MSNSQAASLIWVVPGEWQRNAVTTTIRLLSTLLSRHAIIVDPSTAPAESDVPTIRYAADDVPGQNRIPIDREFWTVFAETGTAASPTHTIEWQQSTYPAWSLTSGDGPPDPVAASFFHYARLEERTPPKLDNHGRFRAHDSWLVTHGLVERPMVHEYAHGLARHLGLAVPALRLWPGDHGFAIAFTHDIDRMQMHGSWSRELRSIGGSLLRGDGIATTRRRLADRRAVARRDAPDPYATLERIVNYHRAHEFGATFFWIATEPSAKDADYRCDSPEMSTTIRELSAPPFECGLHGSYESYRDADALRAQRTMLEQAAGVAVRATRQHYLRFAPAETWTAQANAGLTVDSTLGFAERIGFRAGLAVPFRPWSCENDAPHDLWEVPLVMMDVTLKEYMRLDPERSIERSQKMIDALHRIGGGVSLLWHNSSLNDVDWPEWDTVFDAWLQETRRRGGWGTTVGALADHWATHVRELGNDA